MPFDAKKADDAVAFFRNYLRHTKGKYAGAPFVLESWQADQIVRPIFGTVNEDGTRQYRQVLLEIPRKCGKSEVAAGVATKLLTADGEYGAEIYGAAADREQAAIVYNVVESMIRMNPVLSSRCQITASRRNIAYPKTNSKYRVVSAEGGRQHGLNPSGVIFDEVHVQRGRALWDALTMGSDTRAQPLIFAPTTAGVPDEAPLWWDLHEYGRQVREGIFDDRTFLSIHFGANEKDDFDDPKVWKRCNPALGTFLSMESFKENHQRARRIPSEWNEFLRYRLNYPTQQADRWLELRQWDAAARKIDWDALAGRDCYLGVDLSTRRDITALVECYPMDDGTVMVRPHFFLPKQNLKQRLQSWVTAGHIDLCRDNSVDYDDVFARIKEISQRQNILQVIFDPWNAHEIGKKCENEGLTVVERRFNTANVTSPAKEFEAAIAEGRIVHDGNPVMRWMIDCVSIKSDNNGNILPVKPDRLKSEKRIDGVVAALYGCYPALLIGEPQSEPMALEVGGWLG